MKPAIDMGRMFRMAVQKETAERGHRGRLKRPSFCHHLFVVSGEELSRS